jgi:hypothetical protein
MDKPDPWAKAPFPWFGGKSRAAEVVWQAMGDVQSYVEPFAGSLAVLLRRPHLPNRPYCSETVNDADGLLCNAWRAIQLHPDATAEAASWPVSEADIHARHLAIVRWCQGKDLERLMGDPAWCDVQIAGWWLYGISCWIGAEWCSGTGCWTADADGRLVKQGPAPRQPGIRRQLPHLNNNGQGVETMTLREPGISRQLPHLYDDGQGVETMTMREPGISRQLPHLHDNGQGVETMTMREPGISRRLPQVYDNGRGVEHAGLREPGLAPGEPDHVAELLCPSLPPEGYHPVAMPKLRAWFAALSARLRHVRIVHGDWARVCTPSVVRTLSVRSKGGAAGIFLDPPYASSTGRDMRLYTHDSADLSTQVCAWALEHGTQPDYRIVLAGFDGEHGADLLAAGWREVRWYKKRFLTGGYANQAGGANSNQHSERLWLSPACLGVGLQ